MAIILEIIFSPALKKGSNTLNTLTKPTTEVFFYLRWPEPIYMRVGYGFESRFAAGMI